MGGVPGPRPAPTADKELRGNPGKRPLNKNEAKPHKLTELPEPPDYIGDYGAREWNRVGPELIKLGLMSTVDLQVFEAYCLNVQLMVDARKAIADKGMLVNGARGKVRNPAIAAFASASTAIRGFASEFGLSPSARSRIKLPTDSDDILAGLMGDDDTPDDFTQGV